MSVEDILSKLYEVADDDAVVVLDAVTIKAGLIWVCKCKWHNRTTEDTCENCGKQRRSSS